MDATQHQRIEAARAIVAAPLIVALADNLAVAHPHLAARIRETICAAWEHPGEIVISDAVLHPYIMHLRMSKVPKKYHFELAVPGGFEGALRAQFALFRAAIRSFWQEWCTQHAPLFEELARVCGCPSRLRETETAFYWSPSDDYWVGIFGYYADSAGKKYVLEGR